MKKIIFVLIIAMIVYGIMVGLTLPLIQTEASGLTPFDLRPTGYSVEASKQFISSLSERGLDVYRFIQLPLDFIYPLLLGIFAYLTLDKLLMGLKLHSLRWISLSVIVFDYLENIGIYFMLETQSVQVIKISSLMSVLKALSTSLVLTLLMLLCIYKVVKRINKKENRHVEV